MVSLAVVDPTAQSMVSKGRQIAASIKEKLCFVEIVFLGESV